jgi:hypothetical protein
VQVILSDARKSAGVLRLEGRRDDMTKIAIDDPVTSPAHYTAHPIEIINLSRRLCGPLAQIVQYVMRAHLKGEELQDLRKALFWADDLRAAMAREPVTLACMGRPDFSISEFTRQMPDVRGYIIRRAYGAAYVGLETWQLRLMRDAIAAEIALMEGGE